MAPNFIIDHTKLSLYQNCPFKYYLSEILQLEKIVLDERDTDKLFGQTLHKSLELYYKGKGLQEALQVWDNYEDLVNSKGELLNKKKTKDNGIRLVKEYLTHYQLQDNQQETLAVEIEDNFELAPDIIWKVKIDRIFKEQGNIYVQDHKTTSKIGYNYFSQFQINQQVDGYTNYCKRKYGQCSGFIPNVLEVGWIDKAVLLDIGDSNAYMYSKVEKKYSKYYGKDMLYCSGFSCRFQRDIINRTKEELQDFEQNSINWINKLRQDTTWCKNKNVCNNFKGCDYKELCKMSIGTQLDEQIQEQLYKRKEQV